eukprot:1943437-Prymnesium_polylepis.1
MSTSESTNTTWKRVDAAHECFPAATSARKRTSVASRLLQACRGTVRPGICSVEAVSNGILKRSVVQCLSDPEVALLGADCGAASTNAQQDAWCRRAEANLTRSGSSCCERSSTFGASRKLAKATGSAARGDAASAGRRLLLAASERCSCARRCEHSAAMSAA